MLRIFFSEGEYIELSFLEKNVPQPDDWYEKPVGPERRPDADFRAETVSSLIPSTLAATLVYIVKVTFGKTN